MLGLIPTRLNMFLVRSSPSDWVLIDAGLHEPPSYPEQVIARIRSLTAARGGALRLLLRETLPVGAICHRTQSRGG